MKHRTRSYEALLGYAISMLILAGLGELVGQEILSPGRMIASALLLAAWDWWRER